MDKGVPAVLALKELICYEIRPLECSSEASALGVDCTGIRLHYPMVAMADDSVHDLE